MSVFWLKEFRSERDGELIEILPAFVDKEGVPFVNYRSRTNDMQNSHDIETNLAPYLLKMMLKNSKPKSVRAG
jgi:hypothetical protein